jgi:hypothetical protein
MTTISTPTELITAIPFLLNGEPTNSLVAIALSEGALSLALEVELPQPIEFSGDEEFFTSLRNEAVDQLLLLAYLPTDYVEGDEGRWGVVREHFEKVAPVKDFLIIHGGRWRSLLCTGSGCCDPTGELLPDIQASQMAAEHVYQGLMMPPISTLDGQIRAAEREYLRCEPAQRSKRGVIALLRVISYFTLHRTLGDKQLLGDALVALTDVHVRDFAIGSHGDEHLELHLALWSALLDSAPVGFKAPVATLLALLRYESGDRAGASAALERSLSDDPHYSLAHLLQKTFAAGWPPEAFTTMRHELHPKLRAELLG